MDSQTKFIHMIGIDKREARLIQSFLNLLPVEDFRVAIDAKAKKIPAVIIVDENSHHDAIGKEYPGVLVLAIGSDVGNPEPTYLHRPIQWSKFKIAIDLLKEVPELTVEQGLTQVLEVDGAHEDLDKTRMYLSETGQASYQSQTTEEGSTNEDSSTNETSGLYKLTKRPIGPLVEKTEEAEDTEETEDIILAKSDVELTQKYNDLERLGANINFWGSKRCQVLVGGSPILFIKPAKGMVYSEYGFNDWEALLRSHDARKAVMNSDWEPVGKMKSYPISWLAWASAHARSKGYLLSDLDRNAFFLLNKWPEFDLLYNNNEHLKLCGLMFKEGHSIQELVSKTHIRARIIIGLINACHRHGVMSAFPDKDASRPRVNNNSVDTHTVMSLLSKVFK